MVKTLSILISAVVVIFLMATNSSYAFEENIVAAWLMEEGSGDKIKDFTGNFSDGEIMGNPEWVDGQFGKALKFDGSTVYARIPFNTDFQVLNQGDFTIAGWFKTDVSATQRGGWLSVVQQLDLNGVGRTWLAVLHGGDLSYTFLGGGPHVFSLKVEVGEWFHLAVVVEEGGDSDTIQVYFNGKAETDSEERPIEDCEGELLIGSPRDINALNFWEGLMDELVIINKALTEAELSQLMNTGVQGIVAVESRDKLAATWGALKSSR